MNKKSILQIAETYRRMVQAPPPPPPSPFPPQDPPPQPPPLDPVDPVKPFPPQDPPKPKPLPPVKNKKKKVNEKTSNPVFGIASTYQRLVEAAPPDPWDPSVGPIPPWEKSSGLFYDPNYVPPPPPLPPLELQDILPDLLNSGLLSDERPLPPVNQAYLDEIQQILRSFDNAPSSGSGRAKSIQMAVAALIAFGALAYLTYEDLVQMVEDYFNPPLQVDVPQNFTPYISPYQQMINNLGSERGGYIPPGIFGG